MLKLADVYLSEELTKKLEEKRKIYNERHPNEKLSVQELAVLFLEYGINYLDITAIE